MRAQFSTDNFASVTYTLPINPVEFEPNDDMDVSNIESIDGGTVQQYPYFDSREKTMTWRNLPQKTPYTTMVTTLKSYRGIGIVYLKLNTLNFDSTTVKRIKVTDVITKIREGAGPSSSPYKMSWAEITVKYVECKQ